MGVFELAGTGAHEDLFDPFSANACNFRGEQVKDIPSGQVGTRLVEHTSHSIIGKSNGAIGVDQEKRFSNTLQQVLEHSLMLAVGCVFEWHCVQLCGTHVDAQMHGKAWSIG